MTNNTINVPRELLENIVLCYNEGEFELGTLAAECHALLSATSPAGVDADRNAAFKACPESGCDWGSFYLGWKARGEVEQAIIDGLRGEVAAQRVKTCTALKERNDARDQQTQRIGELEGLLRAESARVDFLDAYIVTADAPDTGKVAMLADSGTLRECIDFTLSADKEGWCDEKLATATTGRTNQSVYMTEWYMSDPETEELPEWAIGFAQGQVQLGAQLRTKDGRIVGNVHIVRIGKEHYGTVYECLTDAGNTMHLMASALIHWFHPPKYICDVGRVVSTFTRPRCEG